MEYRIESDSIGEVKVPRNALWGPQTERSRQNFTAGGFMPLAVIRSLIELKRAAAFANTELANLSTDRSAAIVLAADELLNLPDAELREHFPLKVYQTGSGTQTNMNVNEVIAHLGKKRTDTTLSPNDDVNRAQSSNDFFPAAMHIAASRAVAELSAAGEELIHALREKETYYWNTLKLGRTHLQDATPLTFGQEISGWIAALRHDLHLLKEAAQTLQELPVGGTAVGTGLNAPAGFADAVIAQLNQQNDRPFTVMENKFFGLASHAPLIATHGMIKTLASDLYKIGSDLRFLASGPRGGYGELTLPANEPGSSIMPGKVNPTQIEALNMACLKTIGNDTALAIANSQGNFELNVAKPLIIDAFLESCALLRETIEQFSKKSIAGLVADKEKMLAKLENSLMGVTALVPHIGYENAAKIAQNALKNQQDLKGAALKSGLLSEKQFDQWVDYFQMTNLDRSHIE